MTTTVLPRMMLWFLLTSLGGMFGCGRALTEVVCTEVVLPALDVRLQDSVSGNPITAPGATVEAHDGAYVDVVRTMPGDLLTVPYWLALERAGTYTVRVDQAGYLRWEKSGIVVTRDACHVKTVLVTARLTH